MKDIERLRLEINEIDEKMAKLFIERMKVVEEIAKYKEKLGIDILDTTREKEVIERNSKRVEKGIIKRYYIKFLEDNMKLSKEYQREILGKREGKDEK